MSVQRSRSQQRPRRRCGGSTCAADTPQTVRSPGSESPSQQRASPQRQSPPAAARFRSASDGAAGAGLEDVLVARKSRVERAQEAAATDATRYEALPPAKAAPAEPGANKGRLAGLRLLCEARDCQVTMVSQSSLGF